MTSTRLDQLLKNIDQINQQDPVKISLADGQLIAKEVLYSHRMHHCLSAFAPDANEALQIAAYSQHIQRWAIPRSDYPMDRPGYKRWRTDLGKFHAETTASLMADSGYDETEMERVKYLLQKKGLKRDPDTQTLEDVICLVFIEHYLTDFAQKHSEEKLISIIQKTWNKMSEKGQSSALTIALPDHLLQLVTKALTPP